MLAALVAIALILGIGQLASDRGESPAGDPPAGQPPEETAETDGEQPDDGDVSAARSATEEALDGRPAVPEGAADLAKAAEEAARTRPYSFRITTFNVLGSNHTVPGGSNPGYAAGRTRIGWAAELLAGYGSEIVGFQELQGDQYAVLSAALADGFDLHTPPVGSGTMQTTLAWRRDAWEATWTSAITSPFMGGNRTRPIVRLRHRDTLRELYVINVHNSPQGRQAERDAARAIQVEAINELRSDGLPILLIGDMNERERVCQDLGARADLRPSRGSCAGRMRVDWIFGSPDLTFTDHQEDRSPAVARITDHAVITAGVTVE